MMELSKLFDEGRNPFFIRSLVSTYERTQIHTAVQVAIPSSSGQLFPLCEENEIISVPRMS